MYVSWLSACGFTRVVDGMNKTQWKDEDGLLPDISCETGKELVSMLGMKKHAQAYFKSQMLPWEQVESPAII